MNPDIFYNLRVLKLPNGFSLKIENDNSLESDFHPVSYTG